MRTLAFLPALLLAGCFGLQFGDDDESNLEASPCVRREEALSDLSKIPVGFSEAPETTLAPADGLYVGTLTLGSGEQVPLSVTLSLNRQAVRGIFWEYFGGQQCKIPTLTANLDLTIEAGATLSGVVGGEVTTEGGPGGDLFISASADAAAIMTTLMPPEPPTLSTPLTYRSGVWTGQWEWSATGFETVPLGSVQLSRN